MHMFSIKNQNFFAAKYLKNQTSLCIKSTHQTTLCHHSVHVLLIDHGHLDVIALT